MTMVNTVGVSAGEDDNEVHDASHPIDIVASRTRDSLTRVHETQRVTSSRDRIASHIDLHQSAATASISSTNRR